MKKRCECDIPRMGTALDILNDIGERGFEAHAPNECQCTNELRKYDRDGRFMWLCSMCCLSSDKPVGMPRA